MKKRVLVAVDESEASARVAAFVNDFSKEVDVEIVALHVATLPAGFAAPWAVPVATTWVGYPGAGVYTLEKTADREVEQAVERAGEETITSTGLAVDRTRVEIGDPIGAIDHVASAEDVDLIVVGSAHRNWLERLFGGGSVSRQLAKEAERPVLIV